MNKQVIRETAFGLVGLFSAVILANTGGQTMVHAATASEVVSTQQASAEAPFQLTNRHSNASDHEMGDATLLAATDESKSTKTEHVQQEPAGLSASQSARWLTLAEAAAKKDQAATGRSQKIVRVDATTPTVKSFAIGATDVPDVDAVDVASYQSWMTQADYNTLHAQGVKSVIVKVSEGDFYTNPYAKTAITYAKNAGLGVAVYHYAHFNSTTSAATEAKKTIASVQALGLPKSTRIFADMEDASTAVANVQANLNQYWTTLSAAGYTNHAVYTGGGQDSAVFPYSTDVANTVGATKTWYAAYPYTPTATSTLTSFKGLNYGAWQFSSSAYIPGDAGNTIDASDDYSGVLTNLSSTTTAPAQGPWLSKTGYIKVKNPHYEFWSSFSFKSGTSSAQYNGQELVVKGMYHHKNGSTYYSVYTKAGKWIGYINAAATTWEGEQGAWHSDDRYVTFTRQSDVYSSFNFTKRNVGTLTGNTYHSTGKYYHMNGNTYLSLYRQDGSWVGYVNQNAVTITTQYGAWQPQHGYITFNETGKTAYSDLAHTKVKHLASTMAKHTYKVTGEYRGFNGKVNYSVYTTGGTWLGYVDAAGSTLTGNRQGRWVAHSGYLTTTVKGQTIWSGFDYHHGKSTTTLYQNTYKINGEYFHSNGSKYYSLYDNKGAWVGYLNAEFGSETKGAGGAWLANNQQVKVTAKGYPIWHSFYGSQVGNTRTVYGKTYHATGKYHHFNGSWYDSLYTGKQWLGYINTEALTVK